MMPTGLNALIRADAFKIEKWGPERLALLARHPYQKNLETIGLQLKSVGLENMTQDK